MSELYKCPNCGKEELEIELNNDNIIQGTCKHCGYNYYKEQRTFNANQILPLIKEYAFIIAIISILLTAFFANSLSSYDSTLDSKISTLQESIQDNIDILSADISKNSGDINTHGNLIVNLQSTLDTASNNITALTNLYEQTNNLISQLNSTITNLSANPYQYILDNTIINITSISYNDQIPINNTYYCKIDTNITFSQNMNITEIFLYSPNTNISMISSNHATLNQTQSTDSISNDTIHITAFKNIDFFNLSLNISWSKEYRDTSIFDIDDTFFLIKVDNTYISNITYNEETQ